MKKIFILTMLLISIFTLSGCNNNQLSVNESGKVTSKELIDAIEKVNKESNIYFVKDKGRLSIELNYKNGNSKEVYNNFKDNVNKIIKDNKELILGYKDIKELGFTPLVDKQALGCNILYNVDDNKISINEDNASEDSIKGGLDTLNGDVDLDTNISEETKNTLNTGSEETSTPIPEKGKFNPDTLINDLNIGNTLLEHSTFEVKENKGKKVIVVDLLYKDNALVKGIVTKIQFLLERAFKDSGYDIELCISQKHPMDLYRCKYIDGSWSE